MSLPKLPTPAVDWINDMPLLGGGVVRAATYYTEAQVLQLQRDTVEACAALCHELANTENAHDYVAGAEWCEARILSMRKEETE